MSLSVSSVYKPVVNQYLNSLSHLLNKAKQFCDEKGIDESVLLQDRLAPDMHPLIWQFQMVSEFSARCAARLAEAEIPEYPFTETSIAQLQQRIETVKDFVDRVADEALDAGLERIQEVPLPSGDKVSFRGPIYLSHFFMPNFFFHITTAYNILRKNGVPLGKFDFIGQMPQ